MKKVFSVLLAIVMVCSCMVMASAENDAEIKSYKNVIFMIGDGMGYFHWDLAKQERDIDLFVETAPLKGYSQTRSYDNEVTDSAAGATALACARRTMNGALGVNPHDLYNLFSHPVSLTEVAIENGMKTGIVTSDSTAGATPSGFSVHVNARGESAQISNQQVNSDIDLIWGAACKDVNVEKAESNGFTVVTTEEEMNALEAGSRSFGQFSGTTWRIDAPEGDNSPRLSEMTAKAIELLNCDEDGFFLMIEGAHIDKNSHSQKAAEAAEAMEEFDNAIEAAVRFAEEDGETLVLVTADHETGAIVYDIDHQFKFTSGSHSATNVPIVVFDGDSNFIEDGETIKNTDIPERVAEALDFGDAFPRQADGMVTAFFRNIFDKLFSFIKGEK
ncbi:MAG: alkaline phosphatase [Clostridia bacterium]|nr:alkaline phosphatase [Clostridia bacterium]